MKKMTAMLLLLALCMGMLPGCQKQQTPAPSPAASVSEPEEQEDTSAEASAQSETEADAAVITVDAADHFADGFYCFQMEQDGTLSAEVYSEYDSTELGEEAGWEFYVLDEEFDDALRYLPQAFDSVETEDGVFQASEGQWVYCHCNVNAFSASEIEPGVLVLTLTVQ